MFLLLSQTKLQVSQQVPKNVAALLLTGEGTGQIKEAVCVLEVSTFAH